MIAATGLASLVAFVDASVVTVAVPAIERDLRAGLAGVQWVVTGHLLTAAALLLAGALIDHYGRRRILVAGLLVMLVASVLCSIALTALRSRMSPARPAPTPYRGGRFVTRTPGRWARTRVASGRSRVLEQDGPLPTTLLGRRRETAVLDRLVADVEAGGSRVLILRGEPGVGKSALLRHLSDRVEGWRVASAAGVESEMELAYSALHQLCGPLVDGLERLPVPQRDALETVFGLRPGSAPDPFLVALATLSLVAEAAERRPVACVVDDAQWLDRASAQVLAFVARRLLAERVALVCAARTGSGDDVLAGLPALPVGGLPDPDARALLLASLHGPFDEGVTDRIVLESHGNPLALLELPRTWTAEDLAGGFGLPESRPVTGKIAQSYVQRLQALPFGTQLLVLAAAAEPLGDPVLRHTAAGALGLDMTAIEPAVDAGLLEVRGRVQFAHPLARPAAYRAAAPADRRRVHRALADATNAELDPDRRAWHRARATAGPDEDVAAELERSADRARARGGLAAAGAFLGRAAELSPDPAGRARRALAAASARVQAGAFDTARTLLGIAREGPLDEPQRAQLDMVRARLAFASSRGNEVTALLLGAARRLEGSDPGLARATYLEAYSAAQFATRFDGGAWVVEVARAVRAAPRPASGTETSGDRLLDAWVTLTDDYAGAVPLGRAALAQLRRNHGSLGERLRWLLQGCSLAQELWEDDIADELSQRHLDSARRTGALTELPLASGPRTTMLLLSGRLAEAAELVEEVRSVYAGTGITETPYAALLVAAWRGEEEPARELATRSAREAAARGEGIGVAVSRYAHALLANALGRYDEALAAARDACADPYEAVAHNLGLVELVESAARAGRTDLAVRALHELTDKTQATRTDWALGIEARCRALLGGPDTAEGAFLKAVDHLGRTRLRAELARTHLLYGEWLRQANRRLDARGRLRTALDLFAAMGMAAFAERARQELLLTGAAVRPPAARSGDDLTAQEAQIARLARDGLSNPDIGAHLFLSARTVEWHLRKVFTKLGISSRRELARVLAERDPAAQAAEP
ncbi:MAG TPA: MFS transporter [Mycobacteriales bacterium]